MTIKLYMFSKEITQKMNLFLFDQISIRKPVLRTMQTGFG